MGHHSSLSGSRDWEGAVHSDRTQAVKISVATS